MERLTIDEAIEHAKEVAQEKYNEGFLCHANPNDENLDGCIKCAKEHEQLAEWLEELKEYKRLEEQGLLLKLPCKVGDTVYYISEKIEKQGKKKVSVPIVDKGIVDNITFGSTMIPQITVCNNENIWITFDGVEDFGKTVFLTQAEAEEALKRMEE